MDGYRPPSRKVVKEMKEFYVTFRDEFKDQIGFLTVKAQTIFHAADIARNQIAVAQGTEALDFINAQCAEVQILEKEWRQ